MKALKKFLLDILIFLLVFSLVACGTYETPVEPEKPDDPGTPETPEGPENPTPDESDFFTVSVMYNGEIFTEMGDIEAQWSDGRNVVRAPFNGGVAKAEGLDGDYAVTLTGVPEGYAYNSNSYSASNLRKNITIELLPLTVVQGVGSGVYQAIKLNKTGVYQVTLNSAKHKMFFSFEAKRSGVFSIESWVDVTENMIDPNIEMYLYSTGRLDSTVTGGGTSSDYTSNFRFEAKIDDSNIQYNNGVAAGGVQYIFAVYASAQDNNYPITFNFALQYEKSYQAPEIVSDIVVPNQLPKTAEEIAAWNSLHSKFSDTNRGKSLKNAWSTINQGTTNILDGTRYAFSEEDGYWHVYNPLLYADTDGFGPILYARVTTPALVTDESFNTIEYRGNKCLTLNTLDEYGNRLSENYKLFIEGYSALVIDPPSPDLGPYFCVLGCPCREAGKCDGGCYASCTDCSKDCRRVPEGGKGAKGYADFANEDGLCPVTDELQKFLQKFAISNRYFQDGNGIAETSSYALKSTQENQWLYACCYYR